MLEKDMKDLLKPIYATVERLVPTNRSLINFVNEKALGKGMKRSLYKVKFIDKAERSSYQLASVTLAEFEKHLATLKISDEDADLLRQQAHMLIEDAKTQIAKVYGDVRRYVVTSELREGCLKEHFRKIPNMSEAQNEALSKEIFSMAIAEVNKGEGRNLDNVEAEFEKINYIAIALFNIAAAISTPDAKADKSTAPKAAPKKSFLDRFF